MEARAYSVEEFQEIKNLAEQIARRTHRASRVRKEILTASFPGSAYEVLGRPVSWVRSFPKIKEAQGCGRLAFASIVQELAGPALPLRLVYVSHSIVAKAFELFGSEASREKWLPAMVTGQFLGAFAVHEPDSGSNAGAIRTTAKKDGDSYIVNGSKIFITSAGEADIYMVLVRTDPDKGPPGMSLLIIEKDTAGLSFGRPEDRMGMRSTSSREMFFSDCRVPAQNLVGVEGGWAEIMGKAMMGWGFFGAAAICCGHSQVSHRDCSKAR